MFCIIISIMFEKFNPNEKHIASNGSPLADRTLERVSDNESPLTEGEENELWEKERNTFLKMEVKP